MPTNLNWSEILVISFKKSGLVLTFGPVSLLLLIIAVIVWVILFFNKRNWRLSKWEPVEAELNIANLGKVKIKPNTDTIRIAYQAWVEINTRKVGLMFDDENDVLIEVYNSWYQLFGVLRDLTKQIPAHKLRSCKDTRDLVHYMHKVLNEGLRPHLTKWQAKARHEYSRLREKDPEEAPQKLQRKISNYENLVEDLKRVNLQFIEYGDWLRRIAEGPRS